MTFEEKEYRHLPPSRRNRRPDLFYLSPEKFTVASSTVDAMIEKLNALPRETQEEVASGKREIAASMMQRLVKELDASGETIGGTTLYYTGTSAEIIKILLSHPSISQPDKQLLQKKMNQELHALGVGNYGDIADTYMQVIGKIESAEKLKMINALEERGLTYTNEKDLREKYNQILNEEANTESTLTKKQNEIPISTPETFEVTPVNLDIYLRRLNAMDPDTLEETESGRRETGAQLADRLGRRLDEENYHAEKVAPENLANLLNRIFLEVSISNSDKELLRKKIMDELDALRIDRSESPATLKEIYMRVIGAIEGAENIREGEKIHEVERLTDIIQEQVKRILQEHPNLTSGSLVAIMSSKEVSLLTKSRLRRNLIDRLKLSSAPQDEVRGFETNPKLIQLASLYEQYV